MTVFLDTSALYAVLDRADSNQRTAREVWARLLTDESTLTTTNYVLVEATALVQNRLGVNALRVFHQDIAPLLSVHWVGDASHRSAMSAVLAAVRKKLSLVDCVSFETMRQLEIRTAFCFDKHFAGLL